MTFPYFPLPSSILFLAMPVLAWIYARLQFPFLAPLIEYQIYYLLRIVPIAILVWWVGRSSKALYRGYGCWPAATRLLKSELLLKSNRPGKTGAVLWQSKCLNTLVARLGVEDSNLGIRSQSPLSYH